MRIRVNLYRNAKDVTRYASMSFEGIESGSRDADTACVLHITQGCRHLYVVYFEVKASLG